MAKKRKRKRKTLTRRSSKSGKFVTKGYTKRHPATTQTERM